MKPLTLKGQSKREMLDYIYNSLGFTELRLCMSNIDKSGVSRFSPWVPYHNLIHLADNQYLRDFPFRITKKRFIDQASHRSVLDIELMLDVDDTYLCSDLYSDKKDAPKFENTLEKTKWIVESLRKLGHYPVIHSTGSKGYHISLLLPELREMSRHKRQMLKEQLMRAYGCDVAKKSDKCLIALEQSRHWKSGKMKVEVEI